MKIGEEKNSVSTPNFTVPIVFQGLFGLWLVLCFRYFWNHMGDDSYIFFRYADHIAQHNSLKWNIEGQFVEGFSSPLWVFWLGIWCRFWDVAVVARCTGLFCLLAACWQIVRQSRGSITGVVVLSLLMGVQYWATSGLETPLYLWLLISIVPLLSIRKIEEGRSTKRLWSWMALGALGVTRPEAPVLVLLVVAFRWWQDKRCFGMYTLFPMVLWQVFRMYYFGALLPNTYWAKASGDIVSRVSSGFGYAGWLIVPLSLGVWKSKTKDRWMWFLPWLLWSIVVFGGGDWMWHHRLLVPIFGLIVVLSHRIGGRMVWLLQGTLIPYVMSPLVMWGVFSGLWTGKTLPIVEYQEGNLIEVSENMASVMREVYPSSHLIAVNHAGALPYFLSEYEFIDMSALNEPYLARLEGGLHQKYDPEYILSLKPDVVVLNSFVDPKKEDGVYRSDYWIGETALFQHPQFARDYVPIAQSWRRVRYGGGIASVWLFQRRKGL
jgi:hypothetical protein